MKIVVISRETAEMQALETMLNALGHSCQAFHRLDAALAFGCFDAAECFIVDVSAMEGPESARVLGQVREAAGTRPLLAILGHATDGDSVDTFGCHVDACMSKPLRPQAVMARIQTLLRRSPWDAAGESALVRVGDYELDLAARTVTLGGKSLALSRREFELCLYLFRHIGRLVPRAELETAVWGRTMGATSKTLDTHIYRLRNKLRLRVENGLQLFNAYGQGFRLTAVAPRGAVLNTPDWRRTAYFPGADAALAAARY